MRQDPHRPLDFIIFPASLGLKLHKHKSADIADALKMAFYCARELNGGVIAGAAGWSARKWLASAGIRRKIEHACSDLWHLSGTDLVVEIYDAEREKSVLSIRKTNSTNVSKRYDRSTDKDKEEEEEYIDDDDDSGQARRPKNIHEVEEFLRKHEKRMSREQVEECAADFWRMNEERRWTDSTGEPLRNWQGATIKYADSCRQRYRDQRSGGGWHRQTRTDTNSGSIYNSL